VVVGLEGEESENGGRDGNAEGEEGRGLLSWVSWSGCCVGM